MKTFGIVVHFDILKYLAAGIFGNLQSPAFQHLYFKPAEEGFHVRIVKRNAPFKTRFSRVKQPKVSYQFRFILANEPG